VSRSQMLEIKVFINHFFIHCRSLIQRYFFSILHRKVIDF
jgi:hypothetical protein